MTVTIQEVRDAINIPETSELADGVITEAIARAEGYIAVLVGRYLAPAEFFSSAELNYAIYLAYQSYADRVLNVPPGSYQEGKWEPISEEIVRSTGDKLAGLRQVAFDIIDIIKSYPTRPTGFFLSHTRPTAKFSIGQFDYTRTDD